MPKKFAFPEQLWAGTDHSLALAMDAHNQMMAGVSLAAPDEDEDEPPHNFAMHGDIGIVTVRGSLVNRDSWMNRYFGQMSYAEVRRAMVYAATKADVKAILLDIDSGGGAVNGVADTGDLISKIDKQVKPVYAFTDGTMASAAYWLGSSAREVYGSRTSMIGSIGVIATHMEYSKALKEEGIGVTVVRSGKYKALVNSVEPLTATAHEQLQAQLDSAYGIFIGHVADRRHMTVSVADEKAGQGREFMGQAAVGAGLADGITAFDELLGRTQAKVLDSDRLTQSQSGQYHKGYDVVGKKALTEQEIAALHAGATIEGATPDLEPEGEEAVAAEAETTAEVTEPKEEKSDVVDLLRGMLKTAQDENVQLRLDLEKATGKAASMEGSHKALLAIATQSVAHMRVALRLPALDLSAMSVEDILAQHTSTGDAMKKAYKAGGVAAVTPEEPKKAAITDPLWQARVAATRLTK